MRKTGMPQLVHKNGKRHMRKNDKISNLCRLYRPSRDLNIYDDYVEDILLPADKRNFEKHLRTCVNCSRQVIEAIKRESVARKSPLLSERGQFESLKKKLKYLDEITKRNALCEEEYALAASPVRSNLPQMKGVTYGVAVNKETSQGVMLKCVAVVSGKLPNQSPLEVRARELKSYTRDGLEYKVSVPSTLLENLLKDMFVTHPLLQPLQLYEKTVRVHIDFTDGNPAIKNVNIGNLKSSNSYIYEADSLELAVLIAILSAAEGKVVNSDIVYSSGVSLNGCLEPVGDLDLKIACVYQQGMKKLMMAEANRPHAEEKSVQKTGIALHYFETLDDVLRRLRLVGKETVSKKVGIVKKGAVSGRNKKK